MNYNELNQYILNYIDNDKTNSAVMLTGGWGTGKSYYIENTLTPYLKSHNKECVVVSLYGLKEISDISKSLYFEIKYKNITSKANRIKSKFKNANEGEYIAKTIFKGVISHYGINFDFSDSSAQKVYNSVNFKNRLIVLEDFERTYIDTLDLLGYVNSLVEQDEIKVLIVCNEDELLEYEYSAPITKGRDIDGPKSLPPLKLTKSSLKYVVAKEKSVNDTIYFYPDLTVTIESIISRWNNEYLHQLIDESFPGDLQYIFGIPNPINFRTFIFATQKFVETLNSIDCEKYPLDFIKKIYYSIIAFSIQTKSKENNKWDGNKHYSMTLGFGEQCPLYRSFYDYILYQKCDFSSIDDYYNDYLELFNHQEIFRVFKTYSIRTEKEVVNSLKTLDEKLSKNEISLGVYGEVLLHLVTFEKNISYDITDMVNLMETNVTGKAELLGGEHAFYFATTIDNKDMLERYYVLSTRLIEASNNLDHIYCDFSYNIDMVLTDCSRLGSLFSFEFKNKSLVKKINIKKLSNLFLQCSSEQMEAIRTLFQSVYKHSVPEYDKLVEADGLNELANLLMSADNGQLDKIQLLQLNCFEKQLERYIIQLQEDQING